MMKSVSTILAAIALSSLTSFAADEATPARLDAAGKFAKYDANNDKALSLEEFKSFPWAIQSPAKAETIFKQKDVDSNGSLTFQEYSTEPTANKKKVEKKAAK